MTTSKRSTKLSAIEAIAGDRAQMKALMKKALQEMLEGELTGLLGPALRAPSSICSQSA